MTNSTPDKKPETEKKDTQPLTAQNMHTARNVSCPCCPSGVHHEDEEDED